MKELKNVTGVKTISKKVQKTVHGGHCPPCPPDQCGQINPLTDLFFCVPC